jgi:hypothetical protein
MAPQASKKCGILSSDHQKIGSGKSNSLNSELAPGTFSALTISSLSPQISARREKRFIASSSGSIPLSLFIAFQP